MPATSLPAPGSLVAYATQMGSLTSQPRYFFFCSSEPPSLMGVRPRVLAVMLVWIPEQPYASSSVMKLESTSLNPAPPYSAGRGGFTRPMECASSNTCRGNLDSRSHSAAMGMMRSRAKRRAVSMRARCSSVGSKSNIARLYRETGAVSKGHLALAQSAQLGPRLALAHGSEQADDGEHAEEDGQPSEVHVAISLARRPEPFNRDAHHVQGHRHTQDRPRPGAPKGLLLDHAIEPPEYRDEQGGFAQR